MRRRVTFKYSDINFITLGALVEKMSGETLDVYAQQHIFGPLEMTHTRYLPVDKACGPMRHQLSDRQWRLACRNVGVDAAVLCREGHGWRTNGFVDMRADTARRSGHGGDQSRLRPSAARHGARSNDAADGWSCGTCGSLFYGGRCCAVRAGSAGPACGRRSDFPLKRGDAETDDGARTACDGRRRGDDLYCRWKDDDGHRCAGVWMGHQLAFSRPRGAGLSDRQLWAYGIYGDVSVDGSGIAIRSWFFWPTRSIREELRRFRRCGEQVATAAARALHLYEKAGAAADTIGQTLTGIDVLEGDALRALRGGGRRHSGHLRLGLMTNQTGARS